MVRHHETMNGICAGMGVDGTERLVIPGLNEYNFVAMTESYTQANGDDPLIKGHRRQPRRQAASLPATAQSADAMDSGQGRECARDLGRV